MHFFDLSLSRNEKQHFLNAWLIAYVSEGRGMGEWGGKVFVRRRREGRGRKGESKFWGHGVRGEGPAKFSKVYFTPFPDLVDDSRLRF